MVLGALWSACSTNDPAASTSTGTSTAGTTGDAPSAVTGSADSGSADASSPTGSTTSGAAPDASTGSGSSDSGAADSTTGDAQAVEFCPPALTADALAWKAEFDAFFVDPDSMRRYLDDFPTGSGHWGQTYTLRALVLMYELTGDTDYLDEIVWQSVALAELAEGGVTWPTGVCGNTFEHPTVVIDARLVAPLLRAAWWMANSRLADDPVPALEGADVEGKTYGDIADDIGALATAVLASHEGDLRTVASEDFGPYDGEPSEYYRFPNSYACVAGELMPFNYANSAATAYAALWRLTADPEARAHAERLTVFWWNRTYAHEPSAGSSISRWWGYRGKLGERFDPDAYPGDDDQRPEDVGHADMSSSLAADVYALGLEGLNATRMDQVALTSKRWVDRALDDPFPSYAITGDDNDGEWSDLFDHLPMSCYRASILSDLAAEAPVHLTNDSGDYRRATLENLAEFAFFSEFAGTAPACGPTCGDGICNGPEDCVGCPDDCGACIDVSCR